MPSSLRDVLKRSSIREVERYSAPTVPPTATLADVYRLLDDAQTAAVVVCEEGRPVGVFTHRDVLYRTAEENLDLSTPISELMTTELEVLTETVGLGEAIDRMVDGGFRQIPLVDDAGRFCGLIRARDVLRYVASFFPEAVLNLPPRLDQPLMTPEGG